MPTAIAWCEETWPVTAGCTKVSAGCQNCYAMGMTRRLEGMGHKGYTGLTKAGANGIEWNNKVRPLAENLDWPYTRRGALRIFLDSMSDLFHPGIPTSYIQKVFNVMLEVDWHQYVVLTKRPERAAKLWDGLTRAKIARPPGRDHIIFGTSIENRKALGDRRSAFLNVPSRYKILSIEPLLDSVDLPDRVLEMGRDLEVIVGGESGIQARPMNPEWARNVRDQCVPAGVNFCFKQWGSFAPVWGEGIPDWLVAELQLMEALPAGAWYVGFPLSRDRPQFIRIPGTAGWMKRMSKKAAGRSLNGLIWDERVCDQRKPSLDRTKRSAVSALPAS